MQHAEKHGGSHEKFLITQSVANTAQIIYIPLDETEAGTSRNTARDHKFLIKSWFFNRLDDDVKNFVSSGV